MSELRRSLKEAFATTPELGNVFQLPRRNDDLRDFYDLYINSGDLEGDDLYEVFVDYLTANTMKELIYDEIEMFHDDDERLGQILGNFEKAQYTIPRSKAQRIDFLKFLWNDNVTDDEIRDSLLENNVKKSYLNKIISKSCTSKPSYCAGRTKLSRDEKLDIIINDISKVDEVYDIFGLVHDPNLSYSDKINNILDVVVLAKDRFV